MKLMLKNVRLAFPQLFEPQSFQGEGKPSFSATFILPPNHPQINEIGQTIQAVAKDKFGAKASEVLTQLKAKQRLCFRSGEDKAEYEGFEGNYYISARNGARPTILDRDKSALTAEDGRPYAGCYVNANLDIWPQNNQYGKRINASLLGVQFVEDGDAFGGSAPADPDEFDDLGDGAGAPDVSTGADDNDPLGLGG